MTLTALDFPPMPPFEVNLRRQVFLGYDPAAEYRRCWSGDSDSVGLVGPPRYGKTSGIIIPNLLTWDGPAVVTSTRGDIFSATGGWRHSLAAARGGAVWVYDPFGSVRAATSMRWTPLSRCEDASICYRRVQAMTAIVGQGMTDGEHWRHGAAMILRGAFHAAAVDGLPLSTVRRWLALQDVRDAVGILERMPGGAGDGWAADLQAVERVGERERGSFFSVARNCLDATAEPRALASTNGDDFDVDRFLLTSSTLYIVGPSHYQEVVAPLIVGLIDQIAQRAAELAEEQGGRLQSPLLLSLDEVANIAPLRSLPSLVSEGGGRGIITLWAAQSLSQMRARYGADEQAAILTATTAKLIYGGMSHGDDLRNISAWAGEVRESNVTTFAGGEISSAARPSRAGGIASPSETARQHSVTSVYRPALPVDVLQQTAVFNAWLWYRSDPPLLVDTRPAGFVEPYARLFGLTGYAPPPRREREARP